MNRFTRFFRNLTEKATGNRSNPAARPTVTLAVESMEGREMPATMSLQQLVQTHVNQFTSDFIHAENLKQTVSASTLARDVIALRNDVQSGQMSRVAADISRLTTDLVNEYKAVAYYNSTFGTHYESLFSSDNPMKWTPKTGQSNKLLLAVQERGNHGTETEVPRSSVQGPGGAGSGEG